MTPVTISYVLEVMGVVVVAVRRSGGQDTQVKGYGAVAMRQDTGDNQNNLLLGISSFHVEAWLQ